MKLNMGIGALLVCCILFQTTLIAEETITEQKKVLDGITPDVGFKYFSGYYFDLHNLPAIYAHGYKDASGLTVVGIGFYKEFAMNEWDKAIQTYKALLIIRGYEPH